MRHGREELEKDRDRFLEETLAVLQSVEKIWLAMDIGITSLSEGNRQLFERKDRLIALCRQEREVYCELLSTEARVSSSSNEFLWIS